MTNCPPRRRLFPANRPARARAAGAALLLCGLLSGCAALTNPVAEGVPVRRLPPEVLGRPREEEKTIPLTLLRQKPPDVYRLDAGDVLGVWIEDVLGERGQPPPVRLDQPNLPPGLGYPIPVREDGTVPLPQIPPVEVKGLTVIEAQEKIRDTYLKRKILTAGSERIIVTLLKQRQYHVLVMRQDAGGLTVGQQGLISSTKRGTGASIELPAYENDVLNALAQTGGLPGLDAMNEVIIGRGSFRSPAEADQYLAMMHQQGYCPPGADGADADDAQVVRIPLRARPGEPPNFRPEDVVLQNGDIVFIEARDTELFYTGGLLPPRQFILPRDYDLRVSEAIALVGGPLINGNINQSNLTGQVVAQGLGFPSPSRLTVLRKMPGNRQLRIKVDLNRALQDPRENILVQAGDFLVLQETPGEAIARYITFVFRLNFFGTIIRERDLLGTANLNVP